MRREAKADSRRVMALRMQVKEKRGADFNHFHPERWEGEIFYANMQEWRFAKLALSSKRRGIVAYIGDGRRYEEAYKDRSYFPVFVHIRELEALKIKYK